MSEEHCCLCCCCFVFVVLVFDDNGDDDNDYDDGDNDGVNHSVMMVCNDSFEGHRDGAVLYDGDSNQGPSSFPPPLFLKVKFTCFCSRGRTHRSRSATEYNNGFMMMVVMVHDGYDGGTGTSSSIISWSK